VRCYVEFDGAFTRVVVGDWEVWGVGGGEG
jgi:hypothetical protein